MARKIIVIGGGPAGIEAARVAASAGSKVDLISDGPVGGRAGWHSLLPSKVWLNTAGFLNQISHASSYGIEMTKSPLINPDEIIKRISSVAARWNQKQEKDLIEVGVKVVNGVAHFVSDKEILVKDAEEGCETRLQADAFIIATGSIPRFPAGLKPDGKYIIAPRLLSKLAELPREAVVIGAGATGSETVSLFNQLGIKVTWVVDEYGVLPTFDRKAAEYFLEKVKLEGIRVLEPVTALSVDKKGEKAIVKVSSGESISTERVFVAIGRTPDLATLGLENAGLGRFEGIPPGRDVFGRTRIPWIYLVGDAAGPPMIANRANGQAWVAGRHAAEMDVLPFLLDSMVMVVYSFPEVAQVGKVSGAREISVSYGHILKSHLSDYEGFLKIICTEDRKIAGAVAVGPNAADILSPVAVAIQAQVSLDQMGAVFAAYPTLSELSFEAARQF